jgi:hypothetical protein
MLCWRCRHAQCYKVSITSCWLTYSLWFFFTAGIRYIQENDYPVRGDYDVRDGIDWPRVFAATTSQDSMQQQQQQQ